MNKRFTHPRKGVTAAQQFEMTYIPEPNSGCWLWLASPKSQFGYGSFQNAGVKYSAHRFSYELANGAIPDGLNVLHRCDNPACVNPGHLFLGNNAINVADMVRKGRNSIGANRPQAKLTDDDARAIFFDTRSQRKIAKDFSIDQIVVSRIKRRTAWKHLSLP